MDVDRTLRQAKRTLVAANQRFGWRGDEEDQAWELLVHVMGREPDDDEAVSPEIGRRFDKLIQRRATGEPMAYILGWTEFRDFRLRVKPGGFIPRLTSEFLAEQAIRRLRRRRDPVHVDLATGIGPVAIASARAVPHARVRGIDICGQALSQARANAASLGVGNVRFLRGDLFSPLPRGLRSQVDVITIHPPYVPRSEVADLEVEIKEFEPRHTLSDGSADGLELVRRTVAEGCQWLRPDGWLLIEVTPGEFRRIRPMLREAGYTDIRSTYGALKHTRVITGRYRPG